MRVMVTGASGWIGSAVVPELIAAGHQVLGVARSDRSAERVRSLGADVHRGSIDDPASLGEAADACDGVVHLAYNHDFSQMEAAAETDQRTIAALGTALEGSGRPLLVAAGIVGLAAGRVATEVDEPDPGLHPRIAGIRLAMSFAERGVRSVSLRFPPTVHGPGDHGFIATLVEIARERGVSGYVGDGSNRWPAVHRLDAGRLVALALEGAAAGSSVHAVAEEGVPTRAIAEAIGAGLGVATVSVPVDAAPEHFGWIGRFFGLDAAASSTATRELLGWEPTHPGLLDDLEGRAYFPAASG